MKPNIDITKRISPAEFLKAELEMGIDIQNEAFYNLCKHTAEQIADLGIKTVLDYGAGTGVYAEAYRRLGYKVYAFEIWEEHREYIRKNTQVELVNMVFTTDLMNFIEVAEHMYDKELDSLFNLIKPKYIVFSSTSDVSGEWDLAWGHVNIKFQDEWIKFFESKGYEYLRPLQYPTNYTKLFKLK
jgi:2-polyprenyl-3-methyl-5-hydroxy-6-metoxy-1,4-benzoquinol methylase